MAIGVLNNIKIKGIGCCLPDNKIQNRDLASKYGEETVNKFIEMTGVETRYVSKEEQCASDLAYIAAENLIKELGWEKETIKGIIFLTQSPDYRKPSTALVLQHRLGLSNTAVAFDINLGCSAFIYGLWMSGQMMNNNDIDRMLILIGDTPSKYISEHDNSAELLHGEAGSAIAIEKSNGSEIKYLLKSDGSKFKSIYIPAGQARNKYSAREDLYEHEDGVLRSDYHHFMNGLDIFEFTITSVPSTIKEFIKDFDLDKDVFDYLALHQANKFILKKVSKKVKFSEEKTLINIEDYGNCIGSSIPLLISTELKDKLKEKSLRLLTSGFGIGLSWGVMDLTLDKDIIIADVIYSNEYFTEG